MTLLSTTFQMSALIERLSRQYRDHWPALLISIGAIVPLCVWTCTAVQRKLSPRHEQAISEHDADVTDPGLLKKHSTFATYHVTSTGFTYPSIRTFYRVHPQVDKLPAEPLPLPLLVFIHGLGGSVAQFGPLLTSLVNVSTCLSIDLPGCGRSAFQPKDWDAYTFDALVQLLLTVIELHRDRENGQGVIFIGHSLGCSISAHLASTFSADVKELPNRTVGLVALCPRLTPLSEEQESGARKLLHIPTSIFNLWRMWDRRGGAESNSVHRFVGASAERSTKRLQLRFNEQSRTDVWRRMAHGLLPQHVDGSTKGGLPSAEVWAGIDVPVFLIAGEADAVTSPQEVHKISDILRSSWAQRDKACSETSRGPVRNHHFEEAHDDNREDCAAHGNIINDSERAFASMLKPPRILKSTILPHPASHALLFAPSTCRAISGLIQDFFAEHIDRRLSLGWQLQYLSTEGKWDVKNLAKWEAITPVSEPIGRSFRAMKTMREIDDSHCPKNFVKMWSGKIFAVVDVSHESPVYSPAGLENGGIEYHKFPTVSKLPPAEEEVKAFIELIDHLRNSHQHDKFLKQRQIAVHCHYGFNRTGFFIVCYLVERLGWKLQDAIDEFARSRSPGIKHDYFIDTLFVRYNKDLRPGSSSY